MDLDYLLTHGGSMGRRIAGHDWSTTSLGAIEGWPQGLRTALAICLSSRFPIQIFWGPELLMLYNDAYAPMLGKKHPHALGMPGLGPYAWEELEPIVGPTLRALLAGGPATWEEDQLLRVERNGFPEECYFTYSHSPIHDETGVGGVINTVVETTARVVGERRLRTLRELASAGMVEAASVDDACLASLEVLRRSDADLSFVLLYRVVNGEPTLRGGDGGLGQAAAPEAWPLHEVLASGEPLLIEDVGARLGPLPGGRWPDPTHQVIVLPVPSGGPSPDACLVAGISPRRVFDAEYRGFLDLVASRVSAALGRARSFEEAHARAEALAEIDRAKTTFFDNVSHEFRTPLTLMLGPLRDAITTGAPLDGEDLRAAHRNALRLLRLTNSLLDFARMEAGRVDATFRPTDLSSYTGELASSFRSLVESAGLTLTIECPPMPAEVYVDRRMWERVVLNLLSNAFKHTLVGGIVVRILPRGDEVVVEVEDTGVGIPPEHLERVFERFHRVPAARARSHEGTGIGLALVRELVRQHAGRIEVESEVGRGSTFRIHLPLGSAHLPADRLARDEEVAPLDAAAYLEEAAGWLPVRDPAPSPNADGGAPRARILVADDNADMRGYVRRLLAPHWDVVTVPDGAGALAEARREAPDLVLSDVMMPELDGLGLLQALRADPSTRTLPVVLLSARAGEQARVGGLDAGADDYLVKPFTAEELIARVRSQIQLGRLRRQREAEVSTLNLELERRVSERTSELEASNAELAALAYTMAHDLRAPLRALDRYSSALREEYTDRPLDEVGVVYTQRIGNAARRMDALITNLLDYGRVGRAPAERERVDLAAVMIDIAALHGEGDPERLIVRHPLPTVLGDAVLIEQVLSNLVSNAIKFTASGAAPRVEVGAELVGGTARVWVKDRGIGIASAYRKRIFGVFERLHPAAQFEGTGIGLAIVERAVTRMGGRVGVESEPGVGSRFWFELPVAP